MPEELPRAAIGLVGVSKRFGTHAAVDDVTLEIAEGEFFSLLGPSGCGKTTTLRMVAGFELPDAGRIVLKGNDVTRVPANRRPVNMVFQQYALFPHMSVYDNVAFGLKVKRVPRNEHGERVQEMLRVVSLEGLVSSPAASSNAWHWRARSSTVPRRCSSTNRSARSTSSCENRCNWS